MSKNNMVAAFKSLVDIAEKFRGESPVLNRLYTTVNRELRFLQWELFEQKNMDKIVKHYTAGGKSFALLSAWKDDEKLDFIFNLDRQLQLKQDIQGLGFGYLGVEIAWKSSRIYALLIPNMPKDTAVSLGNKWGQEYVLFVEGNSLLQVSIDYKEERFLVDKLVVHDTDYNLELYSALKLYREKVQGSNEPEKSGLLNALEDKEIREHDPNFLNKIKEYMEFNFAGDKEKELMLAKDILLSTMSMPDAVRDAYVTETASRLVPGSVIYMTRKGGAMIGFVMPDMGLFRVQSAGGDIFDVSDIEEYLFGHSQTERIRTEVFEADRDSERGLITYWIATLYKLE